MVGILHFLSVFHVCIKYVLINTRFVLDSSSEVEYGSKASFFAHQQSLHWQVQSAICWIGEQLQAMALQTVTKIQFELTSIHFSYLHLLASFPL